MAASDVEEALRVPGGLSFGPFTDITQAIGSNGGTAMGLLRDVVLRREVRGRKLLTAPEFGHKRTDHVRGGVDYFIVFSIRSEDPDALPKMFAEFGATGLNGAASAKVGNLASADSIVLMFTPDDRVNHKAVLFYLAIPEALESFDVGYGDNIEVEWLCAFYATFDATDRDVEVKLVGDLSIP